MTHKLSSLTVNQHIPIYMERTPVRALLEVIAGRTGLLECLDEGVTDKRDIEDRLEKSRSTINRWLADFRDAGFITPEVEGHEVTLLGKLAYLEYRSFEQRFTSLHDAHPLLASLPSDVNIDMRLLEEAEVLVSHEIAPQEPILRLEDMVQRPEAMFVKRLSPVVLPRHVDFFYDQITNQGLQMEYVLENQVLEYVLTAYHQQVQEAMESGQADIRRLDGRGVPFGLAIVEDVGVWVGVYEPGGGLRGAIINDTVSAFEWAEETYEQSRSGSEIVEESDIMLRGARA